MAALDVETGEVLFMTPGFQQNNLPTVTCSVINPRNGREQLVTGSSLPCWVDGRPGAVREALLPCAQRREARPLGPGGDRGRRTYRSRKAERRGLLQDGDPLSHSGADTVRPGRKRLQNIGD